jgi:heat shock protein HslJ
MRSHRARLMALMLVVTACGGGTPTPHLSHITGEWALTEVDGAQVVLGVDAGRTPWIGIYSFLWWQRMEGNDGCNSVLAKDLSFSEGVLHPRDTVMTTMRCLDENGNDFPADKAFDRVFSSEQGITVTLEEDVMIWEDGETTLTFQRIDGAP